MSNNLDQLHTRVVDLQKQINEVVQEVEQLRGTVSEPKKEAAILATEQSVIPTGVSAPEDAQSAPEEEVEQIPIVGRSGVFDGIFMMADDGKKFQVPPNYVSKSMLVVGDRLEIVEVDETGSKYSFKQVKNIKRKEVEGILTKKDNQWAIHTDEGIYYVVAAAVRFHKADVGDVVAAVLPAEEVGLPIEWAAFKEIRKQALREKYEPRAKQYTQQKPQEESKEESQDAKVPEAVSVTASQVPMDPVPASAPISTPTQEIVKSRLSVPVMPTSTKRESVQTEPQIAPAKEEEQVVGEVDVSVQGTGEPQTGEVTLHDEDLWELR